MKNPQKTTIENPKVKGIFTGTKLNPELDIEDRTQPQHQHNIIAYSVSCSNEA